MRVTKLFLATIFFAGTPLSGCASSGAKTSAGDSDQAILGGSTKSVIAADGLHGWTDQSGQTPGAWLAVGNATIDSHDDKQLETSPGGGVLVNGRGRTTNLFSTWSHGDVELHLEFMIPRGSNSGVYLMSRYEVQIFDSHAVARPEHKDCGGIYQRFVESENRGYEGYAPLVNASRPPGAWQTLDILFRAPQFEGGRKVKPARFEWVRLNGVVVQKDVDVSGPTRSAAHEDEVASDRLMLQGDHGPVAYRNLQVRHQP